MDFQDRVSDLDISGDIDIEHKYLINLIKKYRSEFEIFGDLPYLPKPTGSGQTRMEYFLNKKQVMFLVMLVKNSELAVRKKVEMIIEW